MIESRGKKRKGAKVQKQIKKLNVVQPNRLDKLKLSTYILFSLASFYNIKNIIFVRYGIREGYLHDMLN